MSRRLFPYLAAVFLHAASFVAPMALAHASPGIRILDEAEIERQTDLRATVRVIAIERTERESTVELRSVVRVVGVSGRHTRALRRGALLTFRTSCQTRRVPLRMSGYPNNSCSSSWWQMPHGLTQQGRFVELPLRLSRGDDGRNAFDVVIGTWPSVGHAFGELGDRRVNRVVSSR